ncbi:Crp/Fnr family transcriptional regulator [Chrysiogenes arsenatis]|uniref:Crp/Fnr family transcriptional regulator n=1 Tax=Chrysiogenes arsenatis TaxID=309797 RepID=UPI0004182C99|nr:cyclic nucleotide-binding domain-containing protein [Chrysiogenes arsenatis]
MIREIRTTINDETKRALLSGGSKVHTFAAAEEVFHEGDIADCVYILIEGEMEVTHRDENGATHLLNVLTPGTIFGEMSVFLNSHRTATIIARTRCRALALDQEKLINSVSTIPSLSHSFLRVLASRIRDINEKYCDAITRTYQLALGCALLAAEQEESGEYQLDLAALAKQCGGEVSVLLEVLRQMQKEGIVSQLQHNFRMVKLRYNKPKLLEFMGRTAVIPPTIKPHA